MNQPLEDDLVWSVSLACSFLLGSNVHGTDQNSDCVRIVSGGAHKQDLHHSLQIAATLLQQAVHRLRQNGAPLEGEHNVYTKMGLRSF